MKNPVHPGELVKANLEELGLSVAAAAKALGVTRQ
jgi:plasmid maintenance system antidote protein VapI